MILKQIRPLKFLQEPERTDGVQRGFRGDFKRR